MNKKLITQIWNERRFNIALFLELLLISVLLWWVVDAFYGRWKVYSEPLGFDISHTYMVTLDHFSEAHPEYDPSWKQDEWKAISGILERIRQRPDVEAACMDLYSHPFHMRASYEFVLYDTLSRNVFLRNYVVSPGFFRVFNISGFYGETPDQLEELFEEEGVMVCNRLFERENIYVEDWRNKCIRFPKDSTYRSGKVLAVLNRLRQNKYDAMYFYNGFILTKFPETSANVNYTLCIRVKDGQDEGFIARFWKDAPGHYRLGNVFVRTIDSYSSIQVQDLLVRYHGMYDTAYYCVLFFLLLNVFLALLGTFWFRTRQRRQEIALQMAMGSSRRQVFVRLISEGVLLLMFATFPALLIDYQLFKAQLVESYFGWVYFPLTLARYFVTVGVTFLLITLTIILSIFYPAYCAMKIPPADALHEE